MFIDEEMALLMQIRMLVLTDGQLVADANIMNRNRPEQVLLAGLLSMATTKIISPECKISGTGDIGSSQTKRTIRTNMLFVTCARSS